MPSPRPDEPPLRVLVLLDPGSPRSEALEAVSALAAGRSARLTGLFIEDADLLRLARLPFAREIRHGGEREEVLEPAALTLALNRQAERMRRLFEKASADLRLQSSFRVVRGEVLEELVRAAADADLLLIGRAGRRAGPRNWRRELLGLLPQRTRKTVIYVQQKWSNGRTVVCYHDGDAESRATLALAARIAAQETAALVVLVPAIETRERLLATVRRELENLRTSARIEVVPPLGSDRILDAWTLLLRRRDARVLLLPADHPEVDDRLLGRLLDRLDCSLVVVGRPPEPAVTEATTTDD